jgi:tetratricopeptide (TPR) repeat protein
MSDPVFETVSKAKRQEESGNPKAAAETLEKFLSENPLSIPPRMELARLYIYRLGDREFGITQLDVILDMDPDNIDALKAATTVMMSDKKYRFRVDEDYTRLVGLVAARKDPKEFAQVCAAYAVFLRRTMVDFPKSGEYYEKAIAAVPDAYEYHQDYAVLLLNDLKDYPKAKTELEEVLRLKPNSISARKNYDLLMKTKYDKDGNLKKPTFFSRFRH